MASDGHVAMPERAGHLGEGGRRRRPRHLRPPRLAASPPLRPPPPARGSAPPERKQSAAGGRLGGGGGARTLLGPFRHHRPVFPECVCVCARVCVCACFFTNGLLRLIDSRSSPFALCAVTRLPPAPGPPSFLPTAASPRARVAGSCLPSRFAFCSPLRVPTLPAASALRSPRRSPWRQRPPCRRGAAVAPAAPPRR